eukprot:3062823-Amphidinium_carterae.1
MREKNYRLASGKTTGLAFSHLDAEREVQLMAIDKGLVVSSSRPLREVTKGLPTWLPCVLHATECMGNPSSL